MTNTKNMSLQKHQRQFYRRSQKIAWIALFMIFLTLPQTTHEFGFSLGRGGGGGDGDASGEIADGSKQTTKRRTVDKKFKFHKIERVYIDDNLEEQNDSDANRSSADGDDDNNEADNDNTGSRTKADEEFQFSRAHEAHKKSAGAKSLVTNSDKIVNGNVESFLSKVGDIFGFGNDNTDNSKFSSTEEQTNNIIYWLKWLGEKHPDTTTAKVINIKSQKEEKVANGWLSYFNRWPFNSLFPFGQAEKPIGMRPFRGRHGRDASDDSIAVQPMSQEHFESLLHTLPGFVVNPSNVADTECRQQLQIFHRQLRAHKLWTLQMLDATGKITSGILRGNINQLGDFELCTQVRTMVKVTADIPIRIRGKYCLAHIETHTNVAALKVPVHLAHGRGLWNSHLGNPSHFVPRYSIANWGICIPHACSAAVVTEMLETNLNMYNKTGVEFHIAVADDDCYMQQNRKFFKLIRKNSKFGISILFIACLAMVTLMALISEYWMLIISLIQKLSKCRSVNENTESENETASNETSNSNEVEENQTESVIEPELSETNAENIAENAITEESSTSTNDITNVNTSFKLLSLEIFRSFSPKRTLLQLLALDQFDTNFPFFHALKLWTTFMLYVCLKYIMIGHLPITNRDGLARTVDQAFSILFRAPIIYADILLLVSGFLCAYQLSEEMQQKSYIQLLKRLAYKVTRYLPTVYVVLSFQTWILPHLGVGPLWSKLIGQNAVQCEEQMWRNVFSAQNAIDFEETCSPLTLQLALDVQLYLLGPLIVWLFYTDSDAGFFVYGAFHAMSVAARYSRTYNEHLSLTLFHGMNVSQFYRTANMIFASPISRATTYLLGIGAGLLYRSENGQLEISSELVPIGWSVALLSIGWCFWSPAAGMRSDFIYSANEAASYAAWSPLVLGLALCWCIFMFPKSENSVLRFLTDSRPIRLLARIAYPMQLATYVVVVWNTASVKESIKYHIADLINFQEVGTILVFGSVLAFLIDFPSHQILHLLINRIFIERPPNNVQEPISGTELSEDEALDEQVMDNATSDTNALPEMAEASNPKEKEQKDVARRSSATQTEQKKEIDEQVEVEEEEEEEKQEVETEEEA